MLNIIMAAKVNDSNNNTTEILCQCCGSRSKWHVKLYSLPFSTTKREVSKRQCQGARLIWDKLSLAFSKIK